MLCANFGWNWPSGSGEKDKNVKFTDRQTDGQMDDGQQAIAIRKALLIVQISWATRGVYLDLKR